jgi:protocatechuate 3,4-dioxygenase beta subunit
VLAPLFRSPTGSSGHPDGAPSGDSTEGAQRFPSQSGNDSHMIEEAASASRRQVLFAGAGALAAVVLAACGGGESDSTAAPDATSGQPDPTAAPPGPAGTAGSGGTLEPTPACVDADDPTPAQTPGPYFKANSPQQADLRAGAGGGTPLDLSGTVVTTGCQPVDRAKIEFWQANAAGEYDNSGYTLRGHQFTDAQGRYAVQTIVPGLYPGRTRHIHVKVQAPSAPVLTTQLYFPGEAQNSSDRLYRSECLIDVRDASTGKEGTFTFVLNG